MSSGGFWPGDPVDDEQEQEFKPVFPGSENGDEPASEAAPEPAEDTEPDEAAAPELEPEGEEAEPDPELEERGHAPGTLVLPNDVTVLEGQPDGVGRSVGVVVSRFNGEVTNKLLESAFGELVAAGVPAHRITVMPVPGAFELPLGAMALAKTRRFACIVALGCVIRGETAHFDYVAGEAASGIQLAALETGVPVAFGLLTVDTLEQAMARTDKGAEAVQTALEMADLFGQLRQQAKSV